MRIIGEDSILKTIVKIVVPFIMIFGIYVILNGHLSPGGGFSGGVILGSGIILYATSVGIRKVRTFLNSRTFTKTTTIMLIFYGLAKGYSFIMGASDLETGIPLGTPGKILSGGLILPLNIAVGVLVGFVIYGLYALFLEGGI